MQRYSNIIQALVYAGAAFLVVIVGLRGLGDLSQIQLIPNGVLDENTGRVSVNIVIFGLVAEFAMLMALAFVFFKAPAFSAEGNVETKRGIPAASSSSDDVAKLVEAERQIIETLGKKIETLIDAECRIISQIGNKYNDLAEAQRQILEILSRRVEGNHSNEQNILKRIETNVDFLKSAHLVRRRSHSENTPTLS